MALLLAVGCKTPVHPTSLQPVQAYNPGPQGLDLSETIAQDQDDAAILALKLRNHTSRTLAIVTGAKLGGTDYPVATFQFTLQLPNGTSPELFCDDCGPASIFGVPPTPYVIFLNPGEDQAFELPLANLSYTDHGQDHHLRIHTDRGASITATLQGLYTEPASWTGRVSATVTLP